jgi:hypothetical protein
VQSALNSAGAGLLLKFSFSARACQLASKPSMAAIAAPQNRPVHLVRPIISGN